MILSLGGLHQWDSLSPYLFILCGEVLSGLISNAQESNLIHGIKIARSAPEIPNLFFIDDSIFFTRATQTEVECLNDILYLY